MVSLIPNVTSASGHYLFPVLLSQCKTNLFLPQRDEFVSPQIQASRSQTQQEGKAGTTVWAHASL